MALSAVSDEEGDLPLARGRDQDINRLRQPGIAGQDLVVLSRYTGSGRGRIVVQGTSPDGPVRWVQQVDFPARERDNAFVARLWASQRVGWLSAEKRKSASRELDDEIRGRTDGKKDLDDVVSSFQGRRLRTVRGWRTGRSDSGSRAVQQGQGAVHAEESQRGADRCARPGGVISGRSTADTTRTSR